MDIDPSRDDQRREGGLTWNFSSRAAIGVLTAAGIYLVLRLRTFPVILGMSLLTYAVNVFLFASGRLVVGRAADPDRDRRPSYTDPLPQALVLTAIVISFGMTAVVVIIALGAYLGSDDDHVDDQRTSRRHRRTRRAPPMTHWIVVPVVLPALLAAFIVLATRHHLVLQRTLLGRRARWRCCAVALGLFCAGLRRHDRRLPAGRLAGALRHRAGRRPAVDAHGAADRDAGPRSCCCYAIGTGWDGRGRHFHALFQFQLMGIMGAFLTGDVFNLFVFFEVLLIASYGLMIHSGGHARLRAGMQYVVYNLLGSTLFLFALGTIYAETGTLNMADLAERVAQIDAGDTARHPGRRGAAAAGLRDQGGDRCRCISGCPRAMPRPRRRSPRSSRS